MAGEHLAEMAQQSEARDISAGVAAVGGQQLHKGRLALLHHSQGPI
jgi:hypothetical protein